MPARIFIKSSVFMYKNNFKSIKKSAKKKKKVAEFYKHKFVEHTDDEKKREKIKQKELGK